MDKKISELDELNLAKNNDLLAIVDSSTPTSLVTKKIKSQNFRNTFLLPIEIINVNNLQETLDGKLNQNSILDGGVY